MRNAVFAAVAVLALFVLPGCDQSGAGAPKAGGLVASAPVKPEPGAVAAAAPSGPSAPPLAGPAGAAAPAAAVGTDPGRALAAGRAMFDGQKPAAGAVAAPGAVPVDAWGWPKKNGVVNAPARPNTLKINAPPAPSPNPTNGVAAFASAGNGAPRVIVNGAAGGNSPPGPKGSNKTGPPGPPQPGKGCPDGMSAVGSFCIDRYEGSLVEVTASGETPWSPYQVPAPGKTYKAVAAPLRPPQGYISQVQAQAACQQAGKRLCGADEWRTACMGSARTTYPYGNTPDDVSHRKCNGPNGKTSTILRLYPGFGFNDYKIMNDPRINQQPDGLKPTGASPECVNDYQVFDMVGNIHEWVSDLTPGGHGMFQGGYYNDTSINGPGCHYRTVAHEPTYHDYSTGFRCCASPAG